jgi:hypothetical protein
MWEDKIELAMGDLLFLIAIVLMIVWLIAFLGFGSVVGSFIHILLAVAILAVIVRLVKMRPGI